MLMFKVIVIFFSVVRFGWDELVYYFEIVVGFLFNFVVSYLFVCLCFVRIIFM